MLTDAARQQIDQRKQEHLARWNGERPLYDTALTTGDYRLAEPGCEVYTRTDGDLALVRMRPDGEARGGIILAIASSPEIDQTTGEIIERRAFRCFDYDPRLRLDQAFTTLTEAQIDPASFTTPQLDRIRWSYRRLCRYIGERRGIASAFEVDLVQDAARLAAIVGQRRGH